MKQTVSKITGSESPGNEAPRQTGLRLGETGSDVAPKTATQKLMEADPGRVDKYLVASLHPLIASSLKEMTVDKISDEFGYERDFIGYSVLEIPDQVTKDMIDQEITKHEAAFLPAPQEIIIKELAAIRVSTVSRNADEDDITFMFAVYAEKLRDYPADIVLTVLRKWDKIGEKWWPTLNEIYPSLDWRVLRRKRRLEALRKMREQFED